MNRLLLIFIAAIATSIVCWKYVKTYTPVKNDTKAAITTNNTNANARQTRLKQYAKQLSQYATANDYNRRYCFLIDMKIACGSNRFFVYDLEKDSVLHTGLVTHGYGNSSYNNISFSNVSGSNSSSLGRYKIGHAYNGKFGLAYKLYGLDKTNSNSINRFVVLHSHDCVPAAEVAPAPICMSQGCPTVAPSFLRILAKYIDEANEPVLLWIFN